MKAGLKTNVVLVVILVTSAILCYVFQDKLSDAPGDTNIQLTIYLAIAGMGLSPLVILIVNRKRIWLFLKLMGVYVRRYLCTAKQMSGAISRDCKPGEAIVALVDQCEKLQKRMIGLLTDLPETERVDGIRAVERLLKQEATVLSTVEDSNGAHAPVIDLISNGHEVSKAMSQLLQVTEGPARPILGAFLDRYIEEERLDIIGKAGGRATGRNLVVTNFVAYSKYVSKMVQTASKLAGQKEPGTKRCVVCFTTLAMPVCKWFNFDGRGTGLMETGRVVFNDTHPDWDSYLWDLRSLLGNIPPDTRAAENRPTPVSDLAIKRCLLSLSDGISFGRNENRDLPFVSSKEMVASLNRRIVVEKAGNRAHFNALAPYTAADIEELVFKDGSDLHELKDHLQVYSRVRNAAYLILYDGNYLTFPVNGGREWRHVGPGWLSLTNQHLAHPNDISDIRTCKLNSWDRAEFSSIVAELQKSKEAALIVPPGRKRKQNVPFTSHSYTIESVGRAFSHLFHRRPDDALFWELNRDDLDAFFDEEAHPADRVPVDMFMIGFADKVNATEVDWVCGLAADTDARMDMVSLEFISKSSKGGRWALIEEFIDKVSKEPRQLSSVMDVA